MHTTNTPTLPLAVAAVPRDRILNVKTKRVDETDALPSLHPLAGKAYKPGSSDVPLWGTLVVCRSHLEAWHTLSDDDKASQRVRMVRVADNKQLCKLIEPGVELCGPHAELYLRVAPTCPAYYAMWDSDASTAHMEVASKLPNSGSRQGLLANFLADGTSQTCPIRLRVRRSIRASKTTDSSVILVDPGNRVVCSSGSSEVDSDMSSSGRANNNRDEEEEEEEGGGDGEGGRCGRGSGDDEEDGLSLIHI